VNCPVLVYKLSGFDRFSEVEGAGADAFLESAYRFGIGRSVVVIVFMLVDYR
jgi:hypothetical protein